MSKQPLFVVASDWHVTRAGVGVWARRPEIAGDVLCGLEACVNEAADLGTDLLAPGDLFDTPDPGAQAVIDACTLISDIQRDGSDCLCRYILGNHDGGEDWLALSSVAYRLDDTDDDVWDTWSSSDGIRSYALSYQPPDALRAAVSKMAEEVTRATADGYKTILVMHQRWREFQRGGNLGDIGFADLPPCDLLVAGDYHCHLDIDRTGESSGPRRVLSQGGVAPQALDEEVPKRGMIVYSDLSVDSFPIPTRKITRVLLAHDHEADALAAAVRTLTPDETLPADIQRQVLEVRVAYGVSTAAAKKLHKAAAAASCHLFLTPEATVKPAAVTVAAAGGVSCDLSEALGAAWAAERYGVTPVAAAVGKTLLDAADPDAALTLAERAALGAEPAVQP